jgi:flagellar hook-basal body complex protein FliE
MKLGEITNSLSTVGKGLSTGMGSVGAGVTEDSLNNSNNSSFSNVLKNSIEELNGTQVRAYDAMEEIATGKVENLQEAVQKIEEAELSLKLGLEVKNKALGAYKQVMSMQI